MFIEVDGALIKAEEIVAISSVTSKSYQTGLFSFDIYTKSIDQPLRFGRDTKDHALSTPDEVKLSVQYMRDEAVEDLRLIMAGGNN